MPTSLGLIGKIQARDACRPRNQEQGAKPPDGGWGWVICIASFFISFIIDGISYSFGLIFVKIDEEFKDSKSLTSWIGSLLLGITLLIAPLGSLVINKYGCIACTILGTMIASLGFAISYFATNILYLIVSIGLVGGIGLGLIYLPAIVIVADWFENKIALATGIAVCGSGVGNFAIAPIFVVLIEKLGWRYTLVISSGCILLCAPLGLTFTKPRGSPSAEVPLGAKQHSGGSIKELIPAPEPEYFHSSLEDPTAVMHIGELLETRGDAGESLTSGVRGESRAKDRLDLAGPPGEGQTHRPPLKWHEKARQRILHSRKYFLLTDPTYLIIVITCFCSGIAVNIPYIYLADLAKEELQISRQDNRQGWLVSSIGICQTVSRLLTGYLSDKKWANRLLIYFCSGALFGLSIAVSAFCTSYVCMVLCASTFGTGCGAFVTLTTVVLIDILGTECLSDAYSMVSLTQGIAGFLGPPIVGAFRDNFENYTYGFIFAGTIGSTSTLLAAFIPLINHYKKKKKALSSTGLSGSNTALNPT